MTTPCLVLPFEVADGAANMALDEALLDEVAEDPTHAVLRTYSWSSPTLSLGYFQKMADAEAAPRWRGAPIVRRPTGGGAIWHHHEVTYALVLPATHPIGRQRVRLYPAVNPTIAGFLRAQGVAAERRRASARQRGAERPFLCFADRDPEDLVF